MVSMITAAELLDYVRDDNPDEVAVGQIEQMKKAAVGYIRRTPGRARIISTNTMSSTPF